MRKTTTKRILLALAASLLPNVYGAGFQINPTASSVARSLGGNGVIGEDLGDMFFNPAAQNLLSSDRALQVGANFLEISNKFRDQGSYSTALGTQGSLPGHFRASDDFGTPIGLFYSQKSPWNDKLRLGISLTSPWGLSSTYDFDWIGRYHATASELTVIDFNVSAALEVSENFHLGFGISAQTAEATLIQAVPTDIFSLAQPDIRAKIEGEDNGIGFNLGFIYSPTDEIRIGLSYRSKVEHDLDGDQSTTLSGAPLGISNNAIAPLNIPESIQFGIHYQPIGSNWSFSAGSRWTAWSRFDELAVIFDDAAMSPTVIPQNWENSLTSGISADYRLSDQTKLIFSIGYDETPVPSAMNRSALVPETDRRVVGFGFERKNFFGVCRDCVFYFGYHRTMVGDRSIHNTNELVNNVFSTTLSGYYEKSHVDVYAGHLQFNF